MSTVISHAQRVTKIDLFSVFIRSLYLEASWNFYQMQNFGFLYALIPVIKKLYPERHTRVRAFKRHLRFFNTHPYFASVILGVTINLEEKRSKGNEIETMDIVSLKDTLMSPLAALGDSLFWATLRPFTALLGTGFVMISLIDKRPARIALIGPLIFLVLFNVPHFYLRWKGILEGYRRGTGIIKILQEINWQRWIEKIKLVSIAVTGAIIAHFISEDKFSVFEVPSVSDIAFLSLVCIFVVGLKLRISPTVLLFVLITMSIIKQYSGI